MISENQFAFQVSTQLVIHDSTLLLLFSLYTFKAKKEVKNHENRKSIAAIQKDHVISFNFESNTSKSYFLLLNQ